MSERSFEDYQLSNEITRALALLKYEAPTEVQSEVIPRALDKQDLIVKSQTGSGKTAAFGIPLCEMIDWAGDNPQALILTPTRELAVQVGEDVAAIGRVKGIKTMAVYGKESFVQQQEELERKTHIIVGTPGRVRDHIDKKTVIVDDIKYLIIDEADEMLSMGFAAQVEAIIEKLPTTRVTMIFSATWPTTVENLCNKYMADPITIHIASTGITTRAIEHSIINVKETGKMALLKNVTAIEKPASCIIFCKTKRQVDTVFAELEKSSYSCEKIHGGIAQEVRFAVMDGFKRGNFRYLVATDVAARGIDVEHISLVINYDVPTEKESYVHRTGRTGRAGKKGKAITFAMPADSEALSTIETYIGFEIPVREAPAQQKVAVRKNAFEEKLAGRQGVKNNTMMKLHFNGGKKKKLRAVDFVGTIANIPGVTADDIGIITIEDSLTYIDMLNGKGLLVLQAMKETTIKGKKLKVSEAVKG
ncbi:DEAD/DEAH box helicase [Sporosarcina limicola]|uniref:Superfamily II DNA/RNA helicase n=1 Tax=Sporosarcina limicola TaxID=34101 RepID=A0A927RFH5_9BACL|nr:DEAD/DEAH box helicase [Sporosarcina limicola]MBE1555512.1 superfamily II DNA/RNA helicase [Sporosarcina limicola]